MNTNLKLEEIAKKAAREIDDCVHASFYHLREVENIVQKACLALTMKKAVNALSVCSPPEASTEQEWKTENHDDEWRIVCGGKILELEGLPVMRDQLQAICDAHNSACSLLQQRGSPDGGNTNADGSGSRSGQAVLLAHESERKTVHEWLNDLCIPVEELGKPICLLRRLRITCDQFRKLVSQTEHLKLYVKMLEDQNGSEEIGLIITAAMMEAGMINTQTVKELPDVIRQLKILAKRVPQIPSSDSQSTATKEKKISRGLAEVEEKETGLIL